MHSVCILIALTSLLAGTTNAGTSPPGVNLRWDECFGDAGAWNKTFACDTNTGSETLVGSFELSSPSLQTAGIEIYIDLRSATATLPAWWSMKNAGTCRPTSLGSGFVPPAGAVNCLDWASGNAAGGIAAYTIGSQGPNHARITAAAAVAPSALADLDPGVEYFAFRLTINHAKTVGTGACAGCDVPVCIFLSRIRVTHPVFEADFNLEQGANYLGSQYVTWQNGYPIDVQRVCDSPSAFCNRHYTTFGCVPYDATPARGSTWGQVKALYR